MFRVILLLFFIADIAYGQSEDFQTIAESLTRQFDIKREKGVTQAELDRLWNNKELKYGLRIARFQIVDQKLYVDSFDVCHYYFILLEYFQNLLKTHQIKNVDFVIYLREGMEAVADIVQNPKNQEDLNIPAFMMFKNLQLTYEADKLLFPDANFLKKDWGNLIDKIEYHTIDTPWQQKINKLFWRGRATAGLYDLEHFNKLARIKLTMLSKLYPNYIDAEYVPSASPFPDNQSGKDLQKIYDILLVSDKTVSEEEHLHYKYLASIDGNSATGTRVPWIMLSSSVLAKQTSSKIEWFYPALKPYVHYVPIQEDLTDILEQIEWMRSHNKEVLKISQNARNFVKNNLMPEHIDQQILLLLNEYHSLQKDQKIIATLTPAEDALSFTALVKILIGKFLKRVEAWF